MTESRIGWAVIVERMDHKPFLSHVFVR